MMVPNLVIYMNSWKRLNYVRANKGTKQGTGGLDEDEFKMQGE